MKTYTFLIGTTDDFESMDELIDHFESGGGEYICNCSAFEFEAPTECDKETVTLIGRGLAFTADWCMDDTYSCVIEGTLDDQAETDMFNEGVKAAEKMKEKRIQEYLNLSQCSEV